MAPAGLPPHQGLSDTPFEAQATALVGRLSQ